MKNRSQRELRRQGQKKAGGPGKLGQFSRKRNGRNRSAKRQAAKMGTS